MKLLSTRPGYRVEYDVASDTVTGNAYWHQIVGHDLTDAEAGSASRLG